MRKIMRGVYAAALLCVYSTAPVFAAADNTLGAAWLFAVVNSDGTLARGSGVTSASQVSPGAYAVIFDRNVNGCVYTATVGTPVNNEVARGVADVAVLYDSYGVFVETHDFAGNLADRPFHLMVFCAK